MAVDGDATTMMLGADAAWSRWLAGVAVARTTGKGAYGGNADGGVLSGTLTAVHPYARFAATDRISAWAALGWGSGDLEFETDSDGAWKTPTAMRMAAAGMRGVFLHGSGGLEVAGRMDARFTRTTSEAAFEDGFGNLAAASGDARRLRLLIEGSRPFALGARRTLTPLIEIGVRQDGGDAETGTGVEAGGALRYLDEALGLSVELAGRRLTAHADGDYDEWGASASVRIDPGAMAPYAGMASSAWGRDWRAGVRWNYGPSIEFGFEATRREFGSEPAAHGLELRFTWRPGGGAGLLRGHAQPQADGEVPPECAARGDEAGGCVVEDAAP